MAVRKYIFTVVFIVLLAVSYFYLINKYNSHTVEFSFSGQLSKADIDNLMKSSKSLVKKSGSSKELVCIVNYIGSYGGSKLIMTTGMDTMANEINLQKGRWIANEDIKEAVLGDKAADKRFRSISVIGKTFKLYGQEYKIVGIIRNSDDIYISFDENIRAEWNKKHIKFIIEDSKRSQLYVELLEGKLKGFGLDVIDVNIYKQEAYLYINIILAIVLFFLLKLSQKLWRKIDKSARLIYKSYREQIRVIEWYKYIYNNKKDVSILCVKLLVEGLVLLAMIKCIKLTHIPPGLIPNNLFSPSSYIDIIKVNLQNYISRLENGISGILLDIHIINLLLILYIGIAVYIEKKTSIN